MRKIYAGAAVAAVAGLVGVSVGYVLWETQIKRLVVAEPSSSSITITIESGELSLWERLTSPEKDPFAPCRAGSIGGGTIGGPFTLVNGDGQTVTEKEVLTKPSLIYFGYTFCPDVCPMDSARNAQAVDLLEEQGIDAQPVFISVDPKRDTPEVVKDFAANLHPKMIGLTGSPEQVKAASLAYKTYFKLQEDDPEFYLVDHSTFTYLVLPEIGFVEFYKRETTPEEMAQSAACFVEAAKN